MILTWPLQSLSPSLQAWIEQREQRATSLSYWAEMSIFSCPWTLEFLVLRPLDCKTLACSPLFHCQAFSLRLGVTPLIPLTFRTLDSDWIMLIPLVLLVLQIADSRLQDSSISITMWTNSYNVSSYIYLYLSIIGSTFSFFGHRTLTTYAKGSNG